MRAVQVNFQVHHLRDRPGYLLPVLRTSRQPFSLDETLSSSLNGAAVVAGTRRGPLAPTLWTSHQGRAVPVRISVHRKQPGTLVFVGSARPNPSFLYEDTERFELLIVIDPERSTTRLTDTRAIVEALSVIARSAVEDAEAPILSLQCPVQLPVADASGDPAAERLESWPEPSRVAIRAMLALRNASSELRCRVVARIAKRCRTNGFGLWISDLRTGHGPGNWINLVAVDDAAAARFRESVDAGTDDDVDFVVPVTLVGPARVGTTNAVLSYLARCDGIGVAGCAISALDDLAFIHLQLARSTSRFDEPLPSHEQWLEFNETASAERSLEIRMHDLVTRLGGRPAAVGDLDGQRDELSPSSRVGLKMTDYQLLAGPTILTSHGADDRKALWFSWRQDSEQELSHVVDALGEAVRLSGMASAGHFGAEGFNIDYLVCRRIRGTSFRAKGKLIIDRRTAKDSVTPSPHEPAETRLSVRLEDAWRDLLDHRRIGGIQDLSVAWREYYLSGRRR
ncbi:hypothetical protein SAMN04488561_4378 [Jiangella alba]|uniref:Uncharacterized protein n=1 Tax=Jiangella alba TaxID=561176 RepID=A0A1H5PJU0_9ACTN|nr:hypothetical protein SAMN04488561_4378 [Jiangella alba]